MRQLLGPRLRKWLHDLLVRLLQWPVHCMCDGVRMKWWMLLLLLLEGVLFRRREHVSATLGSPPVSHVLCCDA